MKAADLNGVSMILAAKSWDVGRANEIYIWKKNTDKQVDQAARAPNHTWDKLKTTIQILTFITSAAFILQNIGVSCIFLTRIYGNNDLAWQNSQDIVGKSVGMHCDLSRITVN